MIALLLSGLCLLYVLSTAGRTHHPGLTELRRWSYAHRGLHSPGVPENSLSAFRAALEAGYGIELDVHLLRDGTLAVMHDSDLLRTTGQTGKIEDLTADGLRSLRLEGTQEPIPQLHQALSLFAGKAPIILELKTAGKNAPQLCAAVCQALQGYSGFYCLESFDPRCLLWLKKHHNELLRGQLTENFLKTGGGLSLPLRFALTAQIGNFLTRPDFVAYRFAHRRNLSNFLVRRLWRVQGVSWTVCTPDDFHTAVQEGWIPIFEDFLP